jgi:hypothetical protein
MQITLTLDDATVNAFGGSGIKLLAWKCVGNSDLATKPLIWSVFQTVYQKNYVSYGSSFSVYTAENTAVTEGSVILPNSEYPIGTDQTLVLTANGGVKVVSGGTVGAVAVTSSSDNISYTCGLSQAQGGSQSGVPYCGATIYPGFEETFYPIDKVLLAFSSSNLSQGEYIASLNTPVTSRMAAITAQVTAITGLSMLLVDLTGSDSRSVSYSIGKGWSKDVWAKEYPSNILLKSILVQGDG